MSDAQQEIYPCVGICIPDADEAYCLGCGRPWGEPRPELNPPESPVPAQPDDAPPA